MAPVLPSYGHTTILHSSNSGLKRRDDHGQYHSKLARVLLITTSLFYYCFITVIE